MKTRASVLLSTLLVPAAFAGVIQTGKSIVFTADDLVSGSGTKQWAIHHPTNSDSDTEVWETFGINQATSAILGRSNSLGPSAYVVWRIEVPSDRTITSFTWGVRQVVLNGAAAPAGDDKFEWQYSTDGSNWTTFFSRENLLGGDASPLYLNNQVLTVDNLPGNSISALFIRGVSIEGPIEGDSGYFQIWSSPTAGGFNPNSYISVTTASNIPEPASYGSLLGVGGLLLAACRRSRSRSPRA
jgi:PEP-CTERM putative exosortase interaction domain